MGDSHYTFPESVPMSCLVGEWRIGCPAFGVGTKGAFRVNEKHLEFCASPAWAEILER